VESINVPLRPNSMYDTGRADSMASVLGEEHFNFRTLNVNKPNTKTVRSFICCSKNIQIFPDNKIITSKYNFLTFLPLNLWLQFSKMANLYFLLLAIMECFPTISDSGGVPVLAVPLTFVVGISMIKDIYEDYMRHRSDKEENNRVVEFVNDLGEIEKTRWKEIRVGQILKINENQYFPCDMVILSSSLPKGICYVETKNLDGETNLKHK
jgi:phospholipid-transporting ATPase